MAIKENFDLPQEVLHKEGNIWINRKNNQLRYSVGENVANEWLNPLSTYKVGTATKLKKGQPVSIGLLEQLDEDCKGVGDNAIVASDPSKNQFSVGILLEPGNKNSTKEVHVQSHGQIVYDLANQNDDNYYLPPHTTSAFDWKYTEIGKPVYVSNKNPGELTLDLAEATYNGGTIICIGRLADAPLASEKEQKIVIEIALSGDVRGVVDTTQISVKMQSNLDSELTATDYKITSDNDKIFAVKIIDGVGYIILNNSQLSSNVENDVVGVFVASPEDGKIDLTQYFGKDIIVTRLGIVEGNFGFGSDSFGKTAFLNDGEVSFSATNDTVEYKVGVGFGDKKFLVDCRYAKSIQKSEMIGTIKPVYGEDLVDPGFTLVDPSIAHTIYDESIDWEPLIRQCYAKDIFVFSATKNGEYKVYNECGMPIEDTSLNSGDGILSKKNKKYFKFRDLYYTINEYDTDGHVTGTKKCACQIKYSREGSPESQAYVWPEQCYQLDIPYKAEGTAGGKLNSSNLKINITNLVQLGAYMDNNGQNIEAYDIIVQEKDSKQTISPGFAINSEGKYFGYEWQITSSAGYTFLNMITQPDGVNNEKCLGITWPIGQKYDGTLQLLVTVRRRPTQYNSLYLNQFPVSNPWTPLVDSANNLVIAGNKIYLGGKVEANTANDDGSSGFTRPVLSSIELSAPDGENTAGIIYKIVDAENKTNKFIEKFSIGEGDDAKEIIWSFDLSDPKNPVAELNASFAASFLAESTADDEHIESVNGVLKLFNALDVSTFLKSNGTFSAAILKSTIDNFIKNGYLSSIFEDTDNLETVSNNEYEQKATPELKNLIEYGWNESHDRISYQGYLGLLAKASKETEQKFLKIEKVLFGIDYLDFDNFSEYNGAFKYFVDDNGILRIFDFLENVGIISKTEIDNNSILKRLVSTSQKLLKFRDEYSSLALYYLFDNYGPYNTSFQIPHYVKPGEGTQSEEDIAYHEIYGDKIQYVKAFEDFSDMLKDDSKTLGDIFDEILQKNIDLNISKIGSSHLSELWSDYKSTESYHLLSFATRIGTRLSTPVYGVDNDILIKVTPADKLIPRKIISGYNTDEDEDVFSGTSEYKGSPFKWPIYLNDWENRAGFTVEENFFGNNIVGISDEMGSSFVNEGSSGYAISKYNFSEVGKKATFSPQSLEGIVYDIIVKLSFIRKQFQIDGTFSSKKTWISSFKKLSWNSSIPTIMNYSEKNLLSDEASTESLYSVFTFNDDKVSSAGSLLIDEGTAKYYNITNHDDYGIFNENEYKEMIGRWGKRPEYHTINGVKLFYQPQLFAIYFLELIAETECDLRNGVLNGVDEYVKDSYGNNTGEKKNRPLNDDELNEYLSIYNDYINSIKTGKVLSKYADRSIYTEDEDEYLKPFGSKSEEVADMLTLTVDDFKNSENCKLCYLNDGEYKSVLSQNYIVSESDTKQTQFAKTILKSYNLTGSNTQIAESIINIIGNMPTLSSDYYQRLFNTWEEYKKGCKTIATTSHYESIGGEDPDKGYWLIYTFYYYDVVSIMNSLTDDQTNPINKKQIFFGFLPTATCAGSKCEKEFPWTQKPIANNNLTWEDSYGKQESTDFNDFINKTFYSFEDFLFNPIEDQNTKVVSEVKNEENEVTSYEWTDGTSNDDKSKHDSAIESDNGLKKLDEYFKDKSDDYSLSSTVKVQIGEKLQPTRINSPITRLEEEEIETKEDRTYEDGYFFDNDTFDETSYDGTSIEFDSGNWKKEKLIDAVDGSPVEKWKTEEYIEYGLTKTRQVRDDIETDIEQSEILASEWKETTLPHRLSSVENANSTTEKKFIQAISGDKTNTKTGLKGTFNNNNSQASYVDTEYSLSGDTTFIKEITHKSSSASLQETVVTGVKTTKKAVTSASKATAGDYEYVSGPESGKNFAAAGTYNVDMSGVTVDLKTGTLSGTAKVTVSSMTPATKTLKISDAETDDFITELSTGEQSFTPDSLSKADGTVKITANPKTKNASFGSKTITVDVADHDHDLTLTKEVVHVYGNPKHYYKNYYTKPLNRKQLKLKDAYEFKPIYKTIDRLSNDRIDYTGEMYHSETTTVKPQIYGKTSEIRKFAFKDNSYINGAMLPVPDIKITTFSSQIRTLFDLWYKSGPNDYKHIGDYPSSGSVSIKNIGSVYSVTDTQNRTMYITYNNVKYKVLDIKILSLSIEKTTDDDIKNAIKIYRVNSGEDVLTTKSTTFSENLLLLTKKQDFFVYISVTTASRNSILDRDEEHAEMTEDASEEQQKLGSFNEKMTLMFENKVWLSGMNIADAGTPIPKSLDFDIWGEFLVKNSLLIGVKSNCKAVWNGSKLSCDDCADASEVKNGLEKAQVLMERRELSLTYES